MGWLAHRQFTAHHDIQVGNTMKVLGTVDGLIALAVVALATVIGTTDQVAGQIA